MKLSTQTIAGHTAVRYRYTAGGCMEFDLNLLCEVGAPYQVQAAVMRDDMAKKLGCTVDTVEIDRAPWVIDVFLKVEK